MTTHLPVALVQFQVSQDSEINHQQARHWLELAMAPVSEQRSPKLVMLPEIWNSPYQAERFAEFAEPIPALGSELLDGPSASLAMVAQFAKSHGVSVIAGSIPECTPDGRIFNTATVISPYGRLLAKHRKMHLFDVDIPGGIHFHESESLTAGDQITVLSGLDDPLETGLPKPPNLGLQICYDIRFPELSLLMQQQMNCTVMACPAGFSTTTGPLHWHLVMRARAVDTQCFVLACCGARPSQGSSDYPSYGHSMVVDPWGHIVAEAGIGEELVRADLDLDQIEAARAAIPTSRQRRLDVYRLESSTPDE